MLLMLYVCLVSVITLWLLCIGKVIPVQVYKNTYRWVYLFPILLQGHSVSTMKNNLEKISPERN